MQAVNAPMIKVRLAVLSDAQAIFDFTSTMVFQTEGKHLDPVGCIGAIKRCISTPYLGCYLLAWDDNDPEKKTIGQTGLTYNFDVSVGGMCYWIQNVYVLPEARNKGVFRALYTQVMQQVKENGPLVKCVRLQVSPTNLAARAAYEKLGMHWLSTHEIIEIDIMFPDD